MLQKYRLQISTGLSVVLGWCLSVLTSVARDEYHHIPSKHCTTSSFHICTIVQWGTRWRSWLRHFVSNGQVAGSIPDGVTGIFHWHNPSSRNLALGLSQPLTEMNTRNNSWGKMRPVRRADNRTTFMCRLSCNLGALTFWNPMGLFRPVMGLLYLYPFYYCSVTIFLHHKTQQFKQFRQVIEMLYVSEKCSLWFHTNGIFERSTARKPFLFQNVFF
jgi:hypothetical protein